MKNKKLILVIALCMAVFMAGCAKKDAPPTETTPAVAIESSIDGTVTDATMNTLTIQSDNGVEYMFSTEEATIEAGEAGLLVGDSVTVYYTGDLTETSDVQPVTVIKVTVADADQTLNTLDGIVKEATTNTLEVKGGDGFTYTFSTEDADIEAGAHGLLVDDTVSVYYYGTLDSDVKEAQQVKVTRVVVKAEPEETLDGTVTNAAMNELRVKDSHGVEYQFATQGAAITPGPNGLIVGDLVRVTYEGALNKNNQVQNVTVEKIVVLQEPPQQPAPKPTPAPAPAPAPVPTPDTTEHMISGVVTAWDGNNLTVNGTTFSVDSANIQAGSDHMGVGDNVSVYYNGLLSSAVSGAPIKANKVAISGWGGSYVEGFVSDSGSGYVVIQIDDHNFLHFNYGSDASMGGASLTAGSYIKVYYFGSLNEGLGQNTPQNVTVHGFGTAPAPAVVTPPVLTPSIAVPPTPAPAAAAPAPATTDDTADATDTVSTDDSAQ